MQLPESYSKMKDNVIKVILSLFTHIKSTIFDAFPSKYKILSWCF